MASGLQLMKITGYTDGEFQTPFKGKPYTVMINPDTIKWQRNIEYNNRQSQDSSTTSQTYKHTPSDRLSFDMVIDCTGVVDAKRRNMAKEVKALESVIFTYNGKIHRPNFVKIQWGKNITFKSVLKTFNTSYTLFKPDGSPLRAKISLTFGAYVSCKTRKKLDNDQSMDLSHYVTTVDGETLPGLCKKIWDDYTPYIQLAKYNDLNKFRHLKGGRKLVLPPILQQQ